MLRHVHPGPEMLVRIIDTQVHALRYIQCFDVSSHHHFDIILHHHFHSCYQHLFKHQLPTCIYSVLAADEGLRGRNVLFTNSVLRPLLKVSQTSIYPVSCHHCHLPGFGMQYKLSSMSHREDMICMALPELQRIVCNSYM